MSVTTENRRVALTGTGVSSWPVSMPVMRAEDISAWMVDTSATPNTVTPITKDVDFTIVLDLTTLPSPFTFALDATLYPAGLAADREIRVVRTTQVLQDQSFPQGDPFPEAAVETMMDRVTIQNQDQKDKVARAIYAHESDPSAVDLELPTVDARKNAYFIFDSDGNPGVGGAPAGTTTVSAWGANWITHADDAAALADLGIDDDMDTGLEAAKDTAPNFGKGIWFSTDIHRTFISDGADWVEAGLQQFVAASVPAASVIGRTVLVTERNEILRDTGAAYKPIRSYPPGFIHGMLMNGAWTAQIRVTQGACRDRLDEMNIKHPSATFDKSFAGPPWVEGDGNAAFATGATPVANAFYAVWSLAKADGSSDIILTKGSAYIPTSAAEVASAGYTHSRRIGWTRVNSGATGFEQVRPANPSGAGQPTIMYLAAGEGQVFTKAAFNPTGLGFQDIDLAGTDSLVPHHVLAQLRYQFISLAGDNIVAAPYADQLYRGNPAADGAPGIDARGSDAQREQTYWIYLEDPPQVREPKTTGADSNIEWRINLIQWIDFRDDVYAYNG